MSWIRYGLFAVFVYLVALAVTVPAARVYDWLGPVEGVQLGELTGTVWRGEAQVALPQGERLDRLSWQFRPSGLLGGQAVFDLSARHAAGEATLAAGIGLDGSVVLRDVSLDLDAAAPVVTRLTGFDWRGRVTGGFSRVHIQEGRVVSARGRVMWQDAGVVLADVVPIGQLMADVGENEGRLAIRLSDTGGPLAVNGNLLRDQPGRLQADIKLAPRANASPVLRDSLSLLGRTERDGSIHLRGPARAPFL